MRVGRWKHGRRQVALLHFSLAKHVTTVLQNIINALTAFDLLDRVRDGVFDAFCWHRPRLGTWQKTDRARPLELTEFGNDSNRHLEFSSGVCHQAITCTNEWPSD